MGGHVREEFEFPCGQGGFLSVLKGEQAVGAVQGCAGDPDFPELARPFRGSAQHGLDAGEQLPDAERLDDVVVRPQLEPLHAVLLLPARREHDDGRAGALRRHDLEHLEAVSSRHGYVQQGQVKVAFTHGADGGQALFQRQHLVAGCGQHVRQGVPDAVVILRNQNGIG